MKIAELPLHTRLAIIHETKLIELRKLQIQGYEKRIELMREGKSYKEVAQAVPGVKVNLQFDWKYYHKVKAEWEKTDKKDGKVKVQKNRNDKKTVRRKDA